MVVWRHSFGGALGPFRYLGERDRSCLMPVVYMSLTATRRRSHGRDGSKV